MILTDKHGNEIDPGDLPVFCNHFGGGETTIKEYLKELLLTLLNEEDCFSGKRPFGNSGWMLDIMQPLVEAGLIEGTLDEEEGWLKSLNREQGLDVLFQIVNELG